MKILFSWLQDYLDIQETPEKISEALLMAGIEVEAIHQPGKDIKNVVTGRVLRINPHPNADNLTVCEVEVGKPEPLTIVCGAKNHRPNDIVPVALVGASLPSGFEIRKAKLRGVESFGMMCSRKELGISEEHAGLYILPPETKIGENIVETLGLNDVVFEVSITPNRGDALSHLGIARELSAIFNLPLNRNALESSEGVEDIGNRTSVTNLAPHFCPRYGARIVEHVKVGESPKWLKDRLEKVGVRSINNVVDITNYVMMDIGHPMHAFDLDKLDEHRIVVRSATQGEKFRTLDDVERTLDASMLVIADAHHAVALAGVMGGKHSEVTEHTTRLLLEAAYFDPTCVRKTAKLLGMMSESSYRFERGTNVENIPIALNLAVRLINEMAGGHALKGIVDSYPAPQPLKRINVRTKRVGQLIGVEFRPHQIETFLHRLKLEVTKDGEDLWVGVPPFRHDLEQEVDIIEEVARLYGYQNIPTTLSSITSVARVPTPLQKMERRVRDHLISLGFAHLMSFSFIAGNTPEAFHEGNPLRLKNPISEEQAILRTSLLPGMFEAMKRNFQVDEFDLRFMEIGRVFQRGGGDQAQEIDRLCLGVSGRINPLNWARNGEEYDLYQVKGILCGIAFLYGLSLDFKGGHRESLHPTQQLEIRCQGKLIGFMGKIHPRFLDNKKYPENVFIAELDLGLLASLTGAPVKMKPIPEFPSIRRDLALEVPVDVSTHDLLEGFKKDGGKLLESCTLFDVYQGKGVELNHRSMAFSFVFRSPERTLTDEEIQPVMDLFIAHAERQHKAKLRSR